MPMNTMPNSTIFPKHIWLLLAIYGLASILHFAHNAEYIAYYPNMPAWITREKVYLAWLVINSVGAFGIVLALARWPIASAICIAAYGALGLDGLGHYALALCSQHTWMMNFTIWFEVLSGAMLAIFASLFAKGRLILWLAEKSL